MLNDSQKEVGECLNLPNHLEVYCPEKGASTRL